MMAFHWGTGYLSDSLKFLTGRPDRSKWSEEENTDPKARVLGLSIDHLSLLHRSVEFLRHWPMEQLRGNPSLSTVYYFDRNQVLVRDSNNSDWIYVVLKGSLSVIKKLKRVEPKNDVITPRKKTKLNSKDPRRTVSFRDPRQRVSQRQRHAWNYHRSRHDNGYYTNTSSSSGVDINNNNFYYNNNNNNNGHSRDGATMSSFRRKFSPEAETFKTPYELEAKLERTLPGYHNSVDRLGSLDYDRIINDHRSRVSFKVMHNGTTDAHEVDHGGQSAECAETSRSLPLIPSPPSRHEKGGVESPQSKPQSSFLPQISTTNKVVQPDLTNGSSHPTNGHVSDDNADGNVEHDDGYDDEADDERWSPISEGQNDRRKHKRNRNSVSKTAKGVYLAPSRLSDRKPSEDEDEDLFPEPEPVPSPEAEPESAQEVAQSIASAEPFRSESVSTVDKENQEETIAEKLAKLQIQYQRRVIDREGRKTIAEELDHKGRRDFRFVEADLDPTIIQLQVLERGQYFGVTQLLFPDQPSLSVVSNGAECLVLSKKLFLQFASDKCMRHLRQTESPFPSEQELSRKLQEAVNWQAARAVVYRKLESDIRRKQALRKQYLPTNLGEYCFRTGPTR